jgi:hypothetical protein
MLSFYATYRLASTTNRTLFDLCSASIAQVFAVCSVAKEKNIAVVAEMGGL